MESKGTHKQRTFARKVAEGSTLADAYADTYDANGSRETIRRAASRLARGAIVGPMIKSETEAIALAELPSRASKRRWVMDRLAKESEIGSDSSRIRALELIGRACGAFEDDSNETNETNETDLLASLRSRLAGVIPQPIEVEKIEDDPEDDPAPP